MADLDDFFAKKDKKKGKGGKKYLSPELLVKQLEENIIKEKELKKEQNKIPEKIEEEKAATLEDQEWNSFVEAPRPDLSNLKLGLLSEDTEKDPGNEEENDTDVNGEGIDSDNPWNKQAAEAAAPVKEVVAAKTGAYVPQHMREAAKTRSKKNAPDLQNDSAFPSLGSERPQEPVRAKKDGFEEVKHGGKQANAQSSASTAPVSTGNQYSSLFNDSNDS